MWRAICSSVLTMLMTATLFWGGCLSCPQFFMFPQFQKTELQKRCCNKTGQCERNQSKPSPVKECKRVALELKDSGHLELITDHLKAEGLPPSNAVDGKVASAYGDVRVAGPAPPSSPCPPDLYILHSAFLL